MVRRFDGVLLLKMQPGVPTLLIDDVRGNSSACNIRQLLPPTRLVVGPMARCRKMSGWA
jgi:hypothetical protein